MKKTEGAQNAGLNRNALWTSSLLALGAMAIAPGAAWAQAADSSQLDDIVVVAQKRSENLQDIPITVTALSDEMIENSGLVDTLSLPTLVSGLSVAAPVGSFQAYIRGIGTTAFGPGIENPVALYIDGVYYESQVTALTDLTDVEQVAVLKGPQGTLFGRNSTGGVIQLTTRQPEAEYGGEFRTELDNYLTSRNNLYITGGGETVRANLSLSYATQDEGYGTNLSTGNDIHKIDHDYSIRSNWIIEPTDATTIRLHFDYVDREGNPAANLRTIPGTTPLQPGENASDPYDTNAPFDTLIMTDGGGFSVDFEHDFGGVRFLSISSYRTSDQFANFDPSLGPQPGIRQRYKQQSTVATQEFQLISPDSEVFNWVLGAFYLNADDSMPYFEQNNSGAAVQPLNILLQSAFLGTESAALFGQTTFQVAPDTRITLGARYTDETRDVSGVLTGTAFFNPFDPNDDLTLVFVPDPNNDTLDFAEWTYRAAIDHRFSENTLAYLSYNRGFKSGGFNGFNVTNAPYDPEIVDSYEIGLKTELFNRSVRLNTAVFYNDFSDIQFISYVNVPTIDNAASAETYGVDIDVQANLDEHWSLTGGLEYLHTEFGAGSEGTVLVLPNPNPGGVGAPIARGDIAGNELAYAPQWTASIALNYDNTFDWGAVNFNITNQYSDGWWGTEGNYPEMQQDAYNLLNSSVTWTSTDGGLSLGLFARNLFDELVANQLTTGTLGFVADYSNPPRTYGATLKYRWGGQR